MTPVIVAAGQPAAAPLTPFERAVVALIMARSGTLPAPAPVPAGMRPPSDPASIISVTGYAQAARVYDITARQRDASPLVAVSARPAPAPAHQGHPGDGNPAVVVGGEGD